MIQMRVKGVDNKAIETQSDFAELKLKPVKFSITLDMTCE